MPSRPAPERAARATAFLTFLLIAMGTVGLGNSLMSLGSAEPERRAVAAPARPTTGPQPPPTKAAVALARDESRHALAAALWRAPGRRALDVANLLASALLILAGSTLLVRRPTAPWWIGQAAVLNMLWSAVQTGVVVSGVYGSAHDLAPVFDREIVLRFAAMQGAPASRSAPPISGGDVVWSYVALVVVLGLVRFAVYAWLLSRSRKPDLSAFLRPQPGADTDT